MMKRLLCISSMALLLVGCTMEQQPDSLFGRSSKTYSIECADYQVTDESGVVTKSVIGVDKSGSDGSQKVSNWNIWVYDHSTGNICNNGKKNIYDETMKTFFTQTSGIDGDLLFPDENGHYDIYILTNVEELTAPTTASAASNYTYTFSSYNSFKPENGGFPMATVYSNFCPATAASHTFMVQRLVSKYDVVIVNDIPNSTFNLSSVFLKQAAKKISPFQENSKISSGSDAGNNYDSFSSVELKKNSNGTYTGELFMLENNQGSVFKSSVSSDKDRIPGNMTNASSADLCTYLEFAGNIDVADGHGQNNISFRHYFGSGRNAGVLRNVNTTVTLTLKDCPSGPGDWRIEPDDPYDSRTVVFEPTSIDVYGDGAWYDVTVTPKSGSPLALNNYINYTLSCSDASSANLTFSGVNFGSGNTGQKTLKIKSTYSGSTPKTVKVNALIDGNKVSELEIIVSKPQNNIDFEWQYDNGFVSGAYWYYRLYKNGTWDVSTPVQDSDSYTSIRVDLTGATKIRLGCYSSRSFAPEQDEEPDEDDMSVIGYKNGSEYDSKSYCGGGKTDVYVDIPISSASDIFKLELADYTSPIHSGSVTLPIEIYCGRYGSGSITITDQTLNSTTGVSFTSSETTAYGSGWTINNVSEDDIITHSFKVLSVNVPTGYKLMYGNQVITSGSTFSDSFSVVYDSKLHLNKALLFTLVESEISNFKFVYSATANCGYQMELWTADQTVCLASGAAFTSGTSKTVTGECNSRLTPSGTYCVRVTRIFGSTTAKVLKYNGTELGTITSSSGSGFLGPYSGSELGITNSNPNTIILNLVAGTATP